MDNPVSLEIDGKNFPDVIPGESNNPLQSYVDLELFTDAVGGSYFLNEDNSVIHLKPAISKGGVAPLRKSICQDTIDAVAKEDSETAGSAPWWKKFKPVCNEHEELVNENSGRAIVFFGHRCPGGAVHVETEAERKAWDAENTNLNLRYDIVNEVHCPCCIP